MNMPNIVSSILSFFRFKIILYPHHSLLSQKRGYILHLLMNRGFVTPFLRSFEISVSIALVFACEKGGFQLYTFSGILLKGILVSLIFSSLLSLASLAIYS